MTRVLIQIVAQQAIYTPDLAAWVEASQPDAWAALTGRYGADAAVKLAERVRVQCDALGVLTVLRHGVEMMGVKGAILLAQFRPPLTFVRLARSEYRLLPLGPVLLSDIIGGLRPGCFRELGGLSRRSFS